MPFSSSLSRHRSARGIIAAAILASSAFAGDSVVSDAGMSTSDQRFRLKVEIKGNARHSKEERFKLSFPFPPEFIPAGQDAVYMETVDEGTSMEVSNVALQAFGDLTPSIRAKVSVHIIDLYNRNPTTSDDLVALREAWVLFGRKQELLEKIPGTTFFAEFGKWPRFTKQLDRRLESYGLWGTAVGRFEEIGLQVGGSFGKFIYWRGHLSNGNPLFFRDPNVLAGDNGTPERMPPNPDPKLESGFPIMYDAKAQDLNFDGKLAWGAGLGFRFLTDGHEGRDGFDILGWYFDRKMEDKARIRGTFYQGDLELLRAAGNPLPFRGNDKKEYGGNVAAGFGGFHLFGQYVSQNIAELKRDGFELELSYRFPLNGVFTSGDEPVLNFIEPVIRYSTIDNRFALPKKFVAPSMGWDWRKYDVGARLGIIRGMDLTIEYARHDMILAKGKMHPDEGLLTLRAAF